MSHTILGSRELHIFHTILKSPWQKPGKSQARQRLKGTAVGLIESVFQKGAGEDLGITDQPSRLKSTDHADYLFLLFFCSLRADIDRSKGQEVMIHFDEDFEDELKVLAGRTRVGQPMKP
jgi:hypothetical protein